MEQYSIYGRILEIPENLYAYIELVNAFQSHLSHTLNQFDEDTKFFTEPSEVTSTFRAFFTTSIRQITQNMVTDGDFACDIDDLVTSNEGYRDILIHTANYYSHCSNVLDMQKAIAQAEMAQAEYDANAKITGLSFGIISNSLIAHLVYSSQNESAIRRQTKEAEDYFRQATQNITINTSKRIKSECEQYYSKCYVPQIRRAIHSVYAYCLSFCLNAAADIYYFDVNEIQLQKYDYIQSCRLIQNKPATGDLEEIVFKALEICPYNIEVYRFANRNGVLTEELQQLSADLGIYGDIFNEPIKRTSSIRETGEAAVRMVVYNDICFSDDYWKMRASSYLQDSIKLAEQHPDDAIANALCIAHYIAFNADTQSTSFWYQVDEYIAKLCKLYGTYDPQESINIFALDLLENVFYRIGEYSIEYMQKQIHSGTEGNLSESDLWTVYTRNYQVAKAAILPLQKLITGLSNTARGEVMPVKRLKQVFLCCVCLFLKPAWMCYYTNNQPRDVLFHLPLSDREFAINIHDKLIAEGVHKYTFGPYSTSPYEFLGINRLYHNKQLWRGEINRPSANGGCYIATAVYGSYDYPQVWTLRRFRDYTLAETWYGRSFIRTYYAISPTLVKWFGRTKWFKKMWKGKLDRMVANLNADGVEDTPYEDRNWQNNRS